MKRETIAVIVMILIAGSLHNPFLGLMLGGGAYMAITIGDLIK